VRLKERLTGRNLNPGVPGLVTNHDDEPEASGGLVLIVDAPSSLLRPSLGDFDRADDGSGLGQVSSFELR
jgi:hypothetical protein